MHESKIKKLRNCQESLTHSSMSKKLFQTKKNRKKDKEIPKIK